MMPEMKMGLRILTISQREITEPCMHHAICGITHQGQFWRMREALVTNAANLAPAAILGYARNAGLNEAAFKNCLESTKYDESIKASLREGTNAGVQGTPSFVIGKSTADGVTGALVVGALPYAVFETEFRKLQ